MNSITEIDSYRNLLKLISQFREYLIYFTNNFCLNLNFPNYLNLRLVTQLNLVMSFNFN